MSSVCSNIWNTPYEASACLSQVTQVVSYYYVDNYFNLSSVFILTIILLNTSYNLIFFCLLLTDAAQTCLEFSRGRVAG